MLTCIINTVFIQGKDESSMLILTVVLSWWSLFLPYLIALHPYIAFQNHKETGGGFSQY